MTEVTTIKRLRKLYLTDIMNILANQQAFKDKISRKLSIFFAHFFRLMIEDILINNKIVYLTSKKNSVYFKLERVEKDQVISFMKNGAYKRADLITRPYAYALFAYYHAGSRTLQRRLISSYVITNEILIRMKKGQDFKNPTPRYFDEYYDILKDAGMSYNYFNKCNLKKYCTDLDFIIRYIIKEKFMICIKCDIFGVHTGVRLGVLKADDRGSDCRHITRTKIIGLRHRLDDSLDDDTIQYFAITNKKLGEYFKDNKFVYRGALKIHAYKHIEDLFYRANKIHIFAIKLQSNDNRMMKLDLVKSSQIEYLFYKRDYTDRLPEKININL